MQFQKIIWIMEGRRRSIHRAGGRALPVPPERITYINFLIFIIALGVERWDHIQTGRAPGPVAR